MKSKTPVPPKYAERFLQWFLKEELAEEVMGDLEEKFYQQIRQSTPVQARRNYWYQVICYLRPFAIKSFPFSNLNPFFMWRHHMLISWRTLAKNKIYSLINIGGLALGLAVSMLIGLWLIDELSFNQCHPNYDRIANVMQHRTIGAEKQTWRTTALPMGDELRNNYSDYFKRVAVYSWTWDHSLKHEANEFIQPADYVQPEAVEILAPQMIVGDHQALSQPNSVLLSQRLAQAIFGSEDPLGKNLKLDNETLVEVGGVYKDFPSNSSYADRGFFISWDVYLATNSWISQMENPWGYNAFRLLVEIAPGATFDEVGARIQNVIKKKTEDDPGARTSMPETFLHPMKDWHLRGAFTNGINTGGRIQYVWLFGLTGVFVLFLACINFMNLSTARSEKRAREVGVRKAVGSVRSQLIAQFLSESFVVVFLAFLFSISLVQLALPWFNEIADKSISLPWGSLSFWLAGLGIVLITGFLAGSYPALYLSSFQAVKTLKGTFRVGRSGSWPRKVMVVTQFTVSIALIVGTLMVYRQIQHAQDRSLGYNQERLLSLQMEAGRVHEKYDVIEQELKQSRVIRDMAKATAPITAVWSTNGSLDWRGKDPNMGADFPYTGVSYNFGKTVGWEFVAGRDFSNDLASDSMAVVVNEAAVKFMDLENPIGEMIRSGDESMQIIGVIKDMLIESPYTQIRPYFYYLTKNRGGTLSLRLNPQMPPREAIQKIESVFATHLPESRIAIDFVDEIFNQKFDTEQRVATLNTLFAILAILISCLGLFGLTAFIAEQRRKEISIRKVLGASITNIWRLLSRDFVTLVLVAGVLAIPIAYYTIDYWLSGYEYRTTIPWWVFLLAAIMAVMITLLTVSFQAIRAATVNPVQALNQE